MQEILVLLIFASAAFFLVRKFYLDFTSDNACDKGCGACDLTKETID
jgi:hypothetical protein